MTPDAPTLEEYLKMSVDASARNKTDGFYAPPMAAEILMRLLFEGNCGLLLQIGLDDAPAARIVAWSELVDLC